MIIKESRVIVDYSSNNSTRPRVPNKKSIEGKYMGGKLETCVKDYYPKILVKG